MNKDGTPENLIPAHPENTNAVSHGAHSSRLIQAGADAIESELFNSYRFTPVERIAVAEMSRLMAIAALIDRHLFEQRLVDKKGSPSYLIDRSIRISRQLKDWLPLVRDAIERQTAADHDSDSFDRSDLIRELARIALGKDPTADARERLIALTQLLNLDERGAVGANPAPSDVDAEIDRLLKELEERAERKAEERLTKSD